jgi:Methyltransferase domain
MMNGPDAHDIDPLTRLAIRNGTDKWGLHFYTPIYHSLFSHLREAPLRLLEIGIGGYGMKKVGGASLAMWAEYFPNGRIVGIDVEEKELDLGPRVTLLKGAQADAAFLARLGAEHGPFDIVIDDGSHRPSDVVASFQELFPRMADGGLYVIEDVQTCFWPKFGGSPVDGGATMKLASRILGWLNHAEIRVEHPNLQLPAFATGIRSLRAYHNLLVIEKGDNSEPSNHGYSLDNPHAARALAMIEAELARAPTAEGIANLAQLYLVVDQQPRAHALVEDALAKWPDHPTLLLAALMATRDPQRQLALAERFARSDPENGGRLIERIKAGAAPADSSA